MKALRITPANVPQGVKVPGMVNTGQGLVRDRVDESSGQAEREFVEIAAADVPPRRRFKRGREALFEKLNGLELGGAFVWTKAVQGKQASGATRAGVVVQRMCSEIGIKCDAFWSDGKFYIRRIK